jgi:hypothetical protein
MAEQQFTTEELNSEDKDAESNTGKRPKRNKAHRVCVLCRKDYFGIGLFYCSRKCSADDPNRKIRFQQHIANWRALHPDQVKAICANRPAPKKRLKPRPCLGCGKPFTAKSRRKYCSSQCYYKDPIRRQKYGDKMKGRTAWNKGVHRATSASNTAKLVARNKKYGTWNKGTKGATGPNSGSFTSERMKGEAHFNWKGGKTSENKRIRGSREYKEWRKKVFERDFFSCVICGHRSSYNFRRGDKCDIRADHIKPFCLFPELRFDLDNGRTLCIPCDLEHGWNSLREMNEQINYHNIKKKAAT